MLISLFFPLTFFSGSCFFIKKEFAMLRYTGVSYGGGCSGGGGGTGGGGGGGG